MLRFRSSVRFLNESDDLWEEHTMDSTVGKLFVRLVAPIVDIYAINPSTG